MSDTLRRVFVVENVNEKLFWIHGFEEEGCAINLQVLVSNNVEINVLYKL